MTTYRIDDLRRWREQPLEQRGIRLGLFGYPVEHSLSPAMQNAALKASGLTMRYEAFEIQPKELAETFELARSLAFVGFNLTIPHKIAALDLVDESEVETRQVGAVNTVRIGPEKLLGFNTDAPAFARAIRESFSVDLRDLRVLLLGATGGAGRAIAFQCAMESCGRLVLVGRSLDKTQALARELTAYVIERRRSQTGATEKAGTRVPDGALCVEAAPWDNCNLRQQLRETDLIVNATPLGLQPSDGSPVPRRLLAPHLLVYDLVYKNTSTPLLAAAAEAGARGADGLTMLLHQGALAFELWFSRPAPLAAMRRALSDASQ